MTIALFIIGYFIVAIISGRIHRHVGLLDDIDSEIFFGAILLGIILWPIGLIIWLTVLFGWLIYKGVTATIKMPKLIKRKVPDLEFIEQAEKELAMGDYSEEAKIAKINALREEIRILEGNL